MRPAVDLALRCLVSCLVRVRRTRRSHRRSMTQQVASANSRARDKVSRPNGCPRLQTCESRRMGGHGAWMGRPPHLFRRDGAPRDGTDARAACTGRRADDPRPRGGHRRRRLRRRPAGRTERPHHRQRLREGDGRRRAAPCGRLGPRKRRVPGARRRTTRSTGRSRRRRPLPLGIHADAGARGGARRDSARAIRKEDDSSAPSSPGRSRTRGRRCLRACSRSVVTWPRQR